MDFISLQPYVLENLNALTGLSAFAYLLVFLGGVASALSPCYSPILLMFGGYVGGFSVSRRAAVLAVALPFIAGTVITMAFVGVLAGWLGAGLMPLLTGPSLRRYIPGLLGIIMGFQLLGVLKLNIPVWRGFRLPGPTGGRQAFALGLPFGVVVTPCTVPIFIAVLGFVVGKGGVIYGASATAAYALGRGLPLLAVGFSSSFLSVLNDKAWGRYLEKISGVMILGTSAYIIFLT